MSESAPLTTSIRNLANQSSQMPSALRRWTKPVWQVARRAWCAAVSGFVEHDASGAREGQKFDQADESSANIESGPVRPVLPYIEYHLVEHCNLSCKGCGHFSPLAAPAFADPHSFRRDLTQLSKLFINLHHLRLMGGEPLLHPTPEAFIEIAREIFPHAPLLKIVTNGTRLKAMPASFWDACRKANVQIDLSLYPAMEKGLGAIQELCSRNEVQISIQRTSTFLSALNMRGDSDPPAAMNYCRKMFYCPFLKDSRLYVCPIPPNVHYFNKKFGTSIVADAGIDIFDRAIDGRKILELLDTPVETCRFCSVSWTSFPWQDIRPLRVEHYINEK